MRRLVLTFPLLLILVLPGCDLVRDFIGLDFQTTEQKVFALNATYNELQEAILVVVSHPDIAPDVRNTIQVAEAAATKAMNLAVDVARGTLEGDLMQLYNKASAAVGFVKSLVSSDGGG